jgi:hypothetical protein
MRPMELIAACQMFLVPASILFGALALASSDQLKTLISVMGLVTSGVWCYRLWFWTGISPIDRNTTLVLAGVFTVAWLTMAVTNGLGWLKKRRPRSGSVLQRAA